MLFIQSRPLSGSATAQLGADEVDEKRRDADDRVPLEGAVVEQELTARITREGVWAEKDTIRPPGGFERARRALQNHRG
jgi:hypothetical protein